MNNTIFGQEDKLENDIALLRPLVPEDYDKLLHFSVDEPSLWKYSLISAAGPENLKNYLDIAFQKKKINDSFPFLVIDKRTNEVAGLTRFYDYQPHHKTIQLGFTWYGKKFQGTGLNKNCKFLMLQYAFETLQLERVEFRADALNVRSIAAMKSLGCTVEGILRSNCASPTVRRDSIILSILKKEWEGGVKEKLLEKIERAKS